MNVNSDVPVKNTWDYSNVIDGIITESKPLSDFIKDQTREVGITTYSQDEYDHILGEVNKIKQSTMENDKEYLNVINTIIAASKSFSDYVADQERILQKLAPTFDLASRTKSKEKLLLEYSESLDKINAVQTAIRDKKKDFFNATKDILNNPQFGIEDPVVLTVDSPEGYQKLEDLGEAYKFQHSEYLLAKSKLDLLRSAESSVPELERRYKRITDQRPESKTNSAYLAFLHQGKEKSSAQDKNIAEINKLKVQIDLQRKNYNNGLRGYQEFCQKYPTVEQVIFESPSKLDRLHEKCDSYLKKLASK